MPGACRAEVSRRFGDDADEEGSLAQDRVGEALGSAIDATADAFTALQHLYEELGHFRRRHTTGDHLAEIVSELRTRNVHPRAASALTELQARLNRLRGEMIFELVDVHGMTHAAISDLLGISRPRVTQLYRQVRERRSA
jgi:hypothetical protein